LHCAVLLINVFFLEYCKTRALPSVRKSEYLDTLGKELYTDIDIMWTGDKVIPEIITKESIIELGEVLQRKPVIWDNIHANDYDQRRVFLGAYCGRPLELYPYLNGVLTNPNCEFEANYIPIHTLGTWCRTAFSTYSQADDVSLDDVPMTDLSDDEASPSSVKDESPLSERIDMLPSLTVADIDSVVAEYNPDAALKLAIGDWIEEFCIDKKAPLKSYSKRNLKTTIVNGQTVLTAIPYDLDIIDPVGQDLLVSMSEDKGKAMNLTDDNIRLITDLFCLPYGHGEKGDRIYQEFEWLLQNVLDIYEQPPSKEKVSRWFDRLLRCDEHCQEIYNLFSNFCKIPNEAILYDLYPYIWDFKEIVLSLDSYVHWLSDLMTTKLPIDTVRLFHHIPDVAIPVIPFISDYTEPWHINYLGGLTVALHRLLPFKGGCLYLDQAPDKPSHNILKLRTYNHSDQDTLNQFCATDEDSEEMLDLEKVELLGEQQIGSYKTLCPKTLFLVEDKANSVCGYIAAVPNNKQFASEYQEKWIPSTSEKFKDNNFISTFTGLPEWHCEKASHITFKLTENVRDECVIRRILNSVLSVLKTSGSTTVYHQPTNDSDFNLFLKLGFYPIENNTDRILWRNL